MYVSEDYCYRFCLTPKLSASSLSYRDLFLDEATDKVCYDCMTVIYWHIWFSFDIYMVDCAFSALTLLVGRQKGIWPVKTEWLGAGVVICLGRGADLHMAQLMPLPLTVSCFSKIQTDFTFLLPAHLGSPGKGPLNVCVCVCACACACVCVCEGVCVRVCVCLYGGCLFWFLPIWLMHTGPN